jgi:CRISPR-associated protein Cas2
MFVLVAYDVEARRTSRYRKILVKYLGHEQFSVFFGDITRSTLEKMRRELNKLIMDGDRVLELIAENRNNLDIIAWSKEGHTEGIPKRQQDSRHKSDSGIL